MKELGLTLAEAQPKPAQPQADEETNSEDERRAA
jgi:hypothetical protein